MTVSAAGKAQLLTVESDSLSTWSNLISEVPELVTKVAHIVSDRLEKKNAEKKLPEDASDEG